MCIDTGGETMVEKKRWKVEPEELLDFIKEEERVNIPKIKKEFGVHYRTAEKYLKTLEEEEKIKRVDTSGAKRKLKIWEVNEEDEGHETN